MIALPTTVRLLENTEAYPLLVIDHPQCRAKVALHGAHLMEWTPAGQEPVIYMSPGAILREGKALRGGVPICWPWFNAHPSDASKPSHGVARSRFWELAEANSDDAGVRLVFTLPCSDAIRAIWNHRFELRLEMQLGRQLELKLITRNLDEEPFDVAGALHTYFTVGDVRQVRVRGLDGTRYTRVVGAANQAFTQDGDVTIEGEFDRVYASTAEVVLVDPVLERRLRIAKSGSASTVIWNPDVANASKLDDLPVSEVPRFLCIEAANANPAAVSLAPGASHVLAQQVSVE